MKDSQDSENEPYRFKSSHPIFFGEFRPVKELIRFVSCTGNGKGDEAVETVQDDVNLKTSVFNMR